MLKKLALKEKFQQIGLFDRVPKIWQLNVFRQKEEYIEIYPFFFESVPYRAEGKDSTKVYAAVAWPDNTLFPSPPKGYPAVVLVHGGGGQVFPGWIKWWTDRGFVALAIDMFSNMLDESQNKVVNPFGGPDEKHSGSRIDGVTEQAFMDSWVYHSVANIILGANLLRANEKIDATAICIHGISWGGVVSCIATGIDARFCAAAIVYAAGFLFDDSHWIGDCFGGAKGTPEREQWKKLYDPSTYLPHVKSHVIFVSGVDDNCFSVINRIKSYALVKQGVFSQRTDLIHGYFWYKTEEIALYFRHVIYGTAFPELRLQRRGSTAELKISGNNNPLQVRFVSTKDCTDDSHSWRFESEDIDPVGKNRYKKQIPVSVKAFLFEVEERDNLCRLSTKIVLTDKKGGER